VVGGTPTTATETVCAPRTLKIVGLSEDLGPTRQRGLDQLPPPIGPHSKGSTWTKPSPARGLERASLVMAYRGHSLLEGYDFVEPGLAPPGIESRLDRVSPHRERRPLLGSFTWVGNGGRRPANG
jgi:hypothetical protein